MDADNKRQQKQGKGHIAVRILYGIMLALIGIIYAGILELSRNTLVGWCAAALIVIAVITGRAIIRRTGSFRWYHSLLSWIVLFGLFAVNYKLSAPPYRNVPAVDVRHPDVTEIVTTAQGNVTGVYNSDHSVEVFAGVPYAKPPVGELRWKEPQDPDLYDGVLACDHFAPMAMQQRSSVIMDSLSRILGYRNYEIRPDDNYLEPLSEDCLYLNIWRPADAGDEPLPVLVYVHGGSLMTGQSYYTDYRGEDLARQGIIVVNFAYRLGIFGYYANEELAEESPNGTTGNYGLLDQIQALKWVNENIETFGGDPSRITIAGESAGSSSVNALCVSPLTEGMFTYAIAESSGILAKQPYHTFRDYQEAIDMGHDILKEMNVANVSELRDIPAERLLATEYSNSAMTIDGYAITEQPYLTYEKGRNHEQALLNGFNAKEADAFLMNYEATYENYEELLSSILSPEYAKEMAELVPAGSIERDSYFIVDAGGDAKGSLDYVYSAAWFSYSHYVWSDYMVKEDRPVYEYYFTKTNPSLSCNHAGELPYAYGNLWRYRKGIYDASDFALSDQMQRYWVNFVKTGDPNGEGLTEWNVQKDSDHRLLELGEQLRMRDDPNIELYKIIDRYQEELMVQGR